MLSRGLSLSASELGRPMERSDVPHVNRVMLMSTTLYTLTFCSGLVPLFSLIYLNSKVYAVLRRRRQLEQRFVNAESNAVKAEAARQARYVRVTQVFVSFATN